MELGAVAEVVVRVAVDWNASSSTTWIDHCPRRCWIYSSFARLSCAWWRRNLVESASSILI